MLQNNKNPYLRKTQFSYKYPTASFSYSQLYIPIVSSCPRKKYSTNYWYDMKSSQTQLSQKIIYRMNIEYNKKINQFQQQKHNDGCLLNNQYRTSSRNNFGNQSLLFRRNNQKQIEDFWGQSKNDKYRDNKDKYRDNKDRYIDNKDKSTNNKDRYIDNKYKQISLEISQSDRFKQYNKIRNKQIQHNEQYQKYLMANTEAGYKYGLKDTFGVGDNQKFMSYTDPKRAAKIRQHKQPKSYKQRQIQQNIFEQQQAIKPKIVHKKSQKYIRCQTQPTLTNPTTPTYLQNQKKIQTNQSIGTFGNSNNNNNKLPKKISFDNKQFVFINLGREEK